MLTVQVEDKFAKIIDSTVKQSGLYSSRSEFIKQAIRKGIEEQIEMDRNLKAIKESRKRLQEKAKFKRELTQKEKDELARKYLQNSED